MPNKNQLLIILFHNVFITTYVSIALNVAYFNLGTASIINILTYSAVIYLISYVLVLLPLILWASKIRIPILFKIILSVLYFVIVLYFTTGLVFLKLSTLII